MKKNALFIILGLSLLSTSSCQRNNEDLATARSKFQTKIISEKIKGDGQPAMPPQDIFSLIYYPAEDGNMAAFLTPDPNDGKRHPAMIWLTGGYGSIGNDDYFWTEQPEENDQTGSAFRKAGIVTMIPSFRGENANPGQYEMLYGEIDDLDAAREYLSKIPYVDPDRIYLAGHSSIGGTRVFLANESLNGFRAAFSLNGIPDLKIKLKHAGITVHMPFDSNAPFDINNPEEFRLRSPMRFVTSIKSPTFYFEGEAGLFEKEFDEMQEKAKRNNIPFYTYNIKRGDYFSIITPVTKTIAEKILSDTGTETNITFDESDIIKIRNGLK